MNKHCFVLVLATLSVVVGCTKDTIPAIEDDGPYPVGVVEESKAGLWLLIWEGN